MVVFMVNLMQQRVADWVESRGLRLNDPHERAMRFMEEALELAQACGLEAREVSRLVDYVFAKDPGEVHQEIGGVMTTLFALGHARGLRVLGCAHDEIERIHKLPAEKFQNRQRRNALDGIGAGPEVMEE